MDLTTSNFLDSRTAIAKELPAIPNPPMIGFVTPSAQNLTVEVVLLAILFGSHKRNDVMRRFKFVKINQI